MKKEITGIRFIFEDEEMDQLYNELTVCLRALGVDLAADRHKVNIPLLYVMYDQIYSVV